MPNIEKLACNFKNLLDAIRIRNRVIEMFERADRETEPPVREALLTFVVAGGGFAGVELAALSMTLPMAFLPIIQALAGAKCARS